MEVNDHAEALQEMKRLSAALSQLRQDLEKSRGETLAVIKEQHSLHDEIAILEQRLDRSGETEKQLAEAVRHAADVTAEIEALKKRQPSIQKLEEQSLSQQREIEVKSQEVQSLGQRVEQHEIRCAQLEVQVREKGRLVDDNVELSKQLQAEISAKADLAQHLIVETNKVAGLESTLVAAQRQIEEKEQLVKENLRMTNRLKELEFKLSVVPNLQKSLQRRDSRIGELESALLLSQQDARKKDEIAAENATIKKQMTDLLLQNSALGGLRERIKQKDTKIAGLETSLTTAQEQATIVHELTQTNSSLKETVASLSSDLEQMNEECVQLESLKETIKTNEHKFADLQKLLASESAQLERLSSVENELQQEHEKTAAMQQQILSLEGAVSNARLDEELKEPSKPRRVVDRTWRPTGPPHNQRKESQVATGPKPGKDDTLDSSAHTTIVPETQLEVPETLQDELLQRLDEDQDDSESELSPLPSEIEDNLSEVENEDAFAKPQRQAHGQQRSLAMGNTGIGSQMPVERAPSSSYESHSDQMLLEEVDPGDAESADDVEANSTFSWNRLTSTLGPSPRRLRSDSKGPPRRDPALPIPENQSGRHRASTPVVRREQYPPNSAAKRRMEPEAEVDASQGNPKKLKRRPANLEIRPPPVRSPKTTADQSQPRGPSSWRKSSTVVGTNAPAPGNSQRTSKPARKSS